jgi:hypothetical protein
MLCDPTFHDVVYVLVTPITVVFHGSSVLELTLAIVKVEDIVLCTLPLLSPGIHKTHTSACRKTL